MPNCIKKYILADSTLGVNTTKVRRRSVLLFGSYLVVLSLEYHPRGDLLIEFGCIGRNTVELQWVNSKLQKYSHLQAPGE